MNDNTMVVVCGYAGDAHQIRLIMPYYLHHRCPVMVLSPSDAPIHQAVLPPRPELGFQYGGKRAYVGQDSLDRQIAHMKLMLKAPPSYKWFLMHDSDSVVLDSHLPSYLYQDPNIFWSNEVSDAMHDDKRAADYSYPHLAFQPPYFASRQVLEKLIEIGPKVPADSNTPFIDWAMMAWCIRAGIPHKNFPDGASCPTNPGNSYNTMHELVDRHGRYILHSIKTSEALRGLSWARVNFKKRFRKS